MKDWIGHIEFKDIVAALAFILSVITFWRTTRTDKKNDTLADEVKKQEEARAKQVAEQDFEKQRQEVRLGIVELSIAFERRERDLSLLLNKAKTQRVRDELSANVAAAGGLLKDLRVKADEVRNLPATASPELKLKLERMLGDIRALKARVPLDDETHIALVKAAENALAAGG